MNMFISSVFGEGKGAFGVHTVIEIERVGNATPTPKLPVRQTKARGRLPSFRMVKSNKAGISSSS